MLIKCALVYSLVYAYYKQRGNVGSLSLLESVFSAFAFIINSICNHSKMLIIF